MSMTPISNRILVELLAARTGQCLPESRLWRLNSALGSLLREHGLSGVDALVGRLAQPGETALARQVVEALLNNETYFFRDRAMFDLIGQRILPELAERRAAQKRIAVWSAGCSTGQEVLSLAMLFAGQARWEGWTIEILGTDVSQAVVDTARRGRYTQFQIQRGLGVTEMIRWFDEADDGWQTNAKLLGMVRYDVRNLFDPLPPGQSRFDIVLCRNVLLYFDAAGRAKAFDRLAGALAPDGWLMLGSGETVIGQTDRLAPSADFQGLYRLAEPNSVSRFSRGQRAVG